MLIISSSQSLYLLNISLTTFLISESQAVLRILMAETAETKKIINPRVEIDTSPPFESVKEAVDRFGGSGPWIPHHLLRLAAAHHESEGFNMEKMEEQAMQLEREVMMKEQQTLNVLKELESAKRFVEGLKFNIIPEMSSFIPSPDHLKLETLCPALMFTELTQAKLNLNKTSLDLAAIQSSVESLNSKLRKDKSTPPPEPNYQQISVQKPDPVPKDAPSSFESEQFRKMTEASRYEVMKAMAEIERTKNCIKMAEMRLNAAKKMEEAAKAVQAIALAENESSDARGITLSYEEYRALSSKAEETKFIDAEVPVLEEKTTKESFAKYKFRSSNRNPDVLNGNEAGERRENGFRSIGDVLSRKFVVQDDVMVGRRVEDQRQHISLSQMLREQSRMILHPSKNGEGNVEKQYFVQRKKFGFIQVPIPTKNSKKKAQAMSMR